MHEYTVDVDCDEEKVNPVITQYPFRVVLECAINRWRNTLAEILDRRHHSEGGAYRIRVHCIRDATPNDRRIDRIANAREQQRRRLVQTLVTCRERHAHRVSTDKQRRTRDHKQNSAACPVNQEAKERCDDR